MLSYLEEMDTMSSSEECDLSDESDIDHSNDSVPSPRFSQVNGPTRSDEQFDTVHPNLTCTVNDAMTMIYAYNIRHNLTWEATEDLTYLINAIIGMNKIPTSKYKFKEKFQRNGKTKATIHYLCHACDMYLGTEKDIQRFAMKVCSNCRSEIRKDIKYKKNHFISTPILHHLENVLKQNVNFVDLEYEISPNIIRDVHDAHNFSKLKNEMGIQPYITITINTDGAAIFKSTKEKSFWPIQFYINEIDLEHRFKRQNMLCSTIAFGKTPNMQVFFRPLIEELSMINENGGVSFIDKHGRSIKLKVVPMLITADAPAKSHVLNLISHNGRFGCPYCLHCGTGLSGTTQYRYCKRGNARNRTNDEARENMLQAHHSSTSVNGYMGLSSLMALPYNFDIVWQVPIDKMHCIDMGVTKRLFNLYLNKKYSHERYAICCSS